MTVNLILFGPPGCGKGTQAALLSEAFGLEHISTGDMFRSELKQETELGVKARSYMSKGELVPDEVTLGMLASRVSKLDDGIGVILDGFPRTVPQAEALEALFRELGRSLDHLISLEVEDELVVKRLQKRGETSNREDDLDPEIARKRIRVYKEETAPVLGYFGAAEETIIRVIDGVGTIPEVFERIQGVIGATA